jgi:mannitol-specific phosphotransferase system IIBC component
MNSTSIPPAQTVTVKSSAVKAGWICLILGFLTFWIFGFGFLFFSVTIVLSIVAMCTNQVKQGVILLISSIASMAICALIVFAVILGTIGAAAQKASDDIKRQQQQQHQPRRYP